MTTTPTRTPRARRNRADQPAPDWDLVYKRNFLERLKRDRPGLDVRDDLPDLIARGYEDIPEEEVVRLYWWGLAHDKPKIGTFMIRIKVSGGLVSAAQLKALGELARTYGRDEAELTTRQGLQLHWVPMAQLPEVLEAIEAAGLTTAGAEGDTVRNITGCPVAGLTAEEPFDVTATINEVAEHMYGNPEYSNLPRKHKYTISGCPAQCNAPEVSDVALIGQDRDGVHGYTMRVGGGMTNTPRISSDLGVWFPADEALEVLRATTDAWQKDLRYRISRARARIKFMVDDYGVERVREKVEAELGRPLADGTTPTPTQDADHIGVHAQAQEGLVYIGVPVPVGRVTGTGLVRLAEKVEEYGGDVRFTRQQNLILGNVPVERLDEVKALLHELGLDADKGRAFARSIACTDHRFCNYSVAQTKGKLDDILEQLTDRFGAEQIGDLAIHVDGCPHACALHWVGEIGLQGTTTRIEGQDDRVEAYDVTVGGGLGTRTAIGRRLLRRVPTDEIYGVLERLVGAWLAERVVHPEPASYTLGDYCTERSDEELVAVATGAVDRTAHPSDEAASTGTVGLRIPGPLQEFVDGADEIDLPAGAGREDAARTVGDVLRRVAQLHPGFGTVVIPDGEVEGAFLVTIGDDDIRTLDGLDTAVEPGQVLSIVMAIAGG